MSGGFYIIVCKRIVIEGSLGELPRNFLAIFIQNGAILSNSKGYICLDIMPQQEDSLPIYCKIINFRRGFNFVIFVGEYKQRK